MQQFNAVFFEEVSEHLTNMESLLLAIDTTTPNVEDLNAIFRAAHSIKGGAGIFGFDDMTRVTHILESLLDRLRKKELILNTDMIDAFLKAGDILAAQKEVHQVGGEPVDEESVKAVCTLLETFSLVAEPCPDARETTVGVEVIEPVVEASSSTIVANKAISFLVATGEEPASLLEELSLYGQLTQHSEAVSGFTKWKLQLRECSASDEYLFDSISFIAEVDSIVIRDIEDEGVDSFGLFDDDLELPSLPLLETEFDFSNHFEMPSYDIDTESYSGNSTNTMTEINTDERSEIEGGETTEFGPFVEQEGCEVDTDTLSSDVCNNNTLDCSKPDKNEGDKVYTDNVDRNLRAEEVAREATLSNPETVKQEKAKQVKPISTTARPVISQSSNISSGTETSIRVNTEKVDQLINQVGELVITQAMLMQISNDLDPSEYDVLLNRLTQLERNTRDLQESVMSIRMMPISFVFGRFPRVVRDLSSKLKKKIELRLVGDDTELDKGLVEQLSDPLTHLIRNSIDHGIEMPEERVAAGKPEMGIITLSAFYESGNVVINISDDGAGLNRKKILEKALERGLGVEANISDSDVYQLIFSAGFSTAEQVTDVSGRGVGMDVVKRNIHTMGGHVEIHSEAGVGSTISIRLPLTLAILDGMSISVAGQVYIIPLTFIAESLQPLPKDIKTIHGKGTVVKVRGEYIPLLALHRLFNIDTQINKASDGILVLLESNNKKIALLVDKLEGQQQVVVKSLETNFHAVPYIAGATIMGDGSVALILDVAGLVSESD